MYVEPRSFPLAKLTAGSPKATTSVPGCIVGGDVVRAPATAASTTASARAAASAARRFTEVPPMRLKGGNASLFRDQSVLQVWYQSVLQPGLEGREERLGGEQQPASLDKAARHAAVHRLDERGVLAADLVVEREELLPPLLVHVRREEVVQVALGAVRPVREDRPDREVRRAWEDVDARVRVDQMELAALAGHLRLAELGAERRVRLEPVAVGMNVHGVAEPGVRRRAVVALEEVLDDDLPVRVRVELDPRVEDELREVEVAREDRGQLSEVLVEWHGLRIRVDEEERAPGSGARGQKRPLVLVEAGLAVGARRRAQRSVEGVRPGVVAALDRLAPAAAVDEHRAAMPADVQECLQLALLVADDEDRDAAGVRRQERTGLGDLVGPAGVLPGAREDPGALAAAGLLVAVPGEWERQRVSRDGHAPMLPPAPARPRRARSRRGSVPRTSRA